VQGGASGFLLRLAECPRLRVPGGAVESECDVHSCTRAHPGVCRRGPGRRNVCSELRRRGESHDLASASSAQILGRAGAGGRLTARGRGIAIAVARAANRRRVLAFAGGAAFGLLGNLCTTPPVAAAADAGRLLRCTSLRGFGTASLRRRASHPARPRPAWLGPELCRGSLALAAIWMTNLAGRP
jgi:hypothetical protein